MTKHSGVYLAQLHAWKGLLPGKIPNAWNRISHYDGVPYYHIARQAFLISWYPSEGAVSFSVGEGRMGLRSKESLQQAGFPSSLNVSIPMRYECLLLYHR